MKNQKNVGILLSYVNTALNMGFNLIMVPMLITALTDAQYGIYKVIHSFAGPLLMLNLGMGTIVTRCVARYQAMQNEQARKEKENTLALAVMISILMAALAFVAGTVMAKTLPVVFGNTYTNEELVLAEKLLMVFVCTTSLHIVSDSFRGCVLGREHFTFYYGSATVQYVLRFLAIVVLITCTDLDAVSVAMVDLFLYAGVLAANFCYAMFVLRERMHLYEIRKSELLSIFSFSSAVLLQAIITQVNVNLDNVILGATILNKRVITMYSSALSIYSIYNSLLSVLINIYFPKATRLVAQDSSGEELTDFAIGPGRIQAMLAVAILGAFGLFGQNFIKIWIGENYQDAAPVAWTLMLAATIPLVQNLCLTIMTARLKQLFRSVVLFGMAVLNAVLSILLVPLVGYWGAAVGTILSLLLGEGLVMNIYFAKVLKMNVFRMLREIFAGILPAGLVSVAVCLPLAMFVDDTIVGFLVKCTVFVCVYGLLLWKRGMRVDEKEMILEQLKARGFGRKKQ